MSGTPAPRINLHGLALTGTLIAVFDGLHALCDQVVQDSHDAVTKAMHGSHLVYVNDGTPVKEDPWRHGKEGRTCTASAYGRRSVSRHVGSYSAVQLAASITVTRVFGYRVPVRTLLAGTAVNALTHAVIDRREPLLWLAGKIGKSGYIEHATVVRKPATDTKAPVVEESGPGTALMEIDQALHRAIGVGAAVLTAWLATRREGRK
ncbi:hypothetical protein ACWD26_30095 [Streptomyces sp. NPDC002787]